MIYKVFCSDKLEFFFLYSRICSECVSISVLAWLCFSSVYEFKNEFKNDHMTCLNDFNCLISGPGLAQQDLNI